MHHSTGATFTSGAFRVDSHVFLEHVRARERVLRENIWKRDILNRLPLRPRTSTENTSFRSSRRVRICVTPSVLATYW
jgi:hypothetical protein